MAEDLPDPKEIADNVADFHDALVARTISGKLIEQLDVVYLTSILVKTPEPPDPNKTNPPEKGGTSREN